VFYQNPTPAVAVILLKADQVLLVKRKYEPKAGDWSLPAGFLEYDETVEETARREAKEETGLDIALDGIFGVYSGFEDPRAQVLLVVYRGTIVGGELKAGDDAEEARFFALKELPGNIAFLTHRQVLNQLRQEKRRNE